MLPQDVDHSIQCIEAITRNILNSYPYDTKDSSLELYYSCSELSSNVRKDGLKSSQIHILLDCYISLSSYIEANRAALFVDRKSRNATHMCISNNLFFLLCVSFYLLRYTCIPSEELLEESLLNLLTSLNTVSLISKVFILGFIANMLDFVKNDSLLCFYCLNNLMESVCSSYDDYKHEHQKYYRKLNGYTHESDIIKSLLTKSELLRLLLDDKPEVKLYLINICSINIIYRISKISDISVHHLALVERVLQRIQGVRDRYSFKLCKALISLKALYETFLQRKIASRFIDTSKYCIDVSWIKDTLTSSFKDRNKILINLAKARLPGRTLHQVSYSIQLYNNFNRPCISMSDIFPNHEVHHMNSFLKPLFSVPYPMCIGALFKPYSDQNRNAINTTVVCFYLDQLTAIVNRHFIKNNTCDLAKEHLASWKRYVLYLVSVGTRKNQYVRSLFRVYPISCEFYQEVIRLSFENIIYEEDSVFEYIIDAFIEFVSDWAKIKNLENVVEEYTKRVSVYLECSFLLPIIAQNRSFTIESAIIKFYNAIINLSIHNKFKFFLLPCKNIFNLLLLSKNHKNISDLCALMNSYRQFIDCLSDSEAQFVDVNTLNSYILTLSSALWKGNLFENKGIYLPVSSSMDMYGYLKSKGVKSNILKITNSVTFTSLTMKYLKFLALESGLDDTVEIDQSLIRESLKSFFVDYIKSKGCKGLHEFLHNFIRTIKK